MIHNISKFVPASKSFT